MRNEYPRPQLKRGQWLNLNGKWDFKFDDSNIGMKEKWYKNKKFDNTINVPFAYQSELSNVKDKEEHNTLWYKREFNIPKEWNEKVYLNFGASDYETIVFINGQRVGSHVGGNTSFRFEISNYLTYDVEEVVVYVNDDAFEERITRGKQAWTEEPNSIWYTRTVGLWQTVWLEPVSNHFIDKLKIDTNIDEGTVKFDVETNTKNTKELLVEIFDENELVVKDTYSFKNLLVRDIKIWNNQIFKTNLHNHGKTWSPENPHLYDVKLSLLVDGEIQDEVNTYFGMRKLHTENGMFYLNNRPYYLKLVLDQGYFKEGLLTAPTDKDLRKDIELSKEMGFNGCRKHQMVPEERFYYHADKLGYLVWAEIPSTVSYDEYYNERAVKELSEIIKRDYNHPSIMAWVVLNESWGVPQINFNSMQQNYALSLYHFAKSMDKSRLVISNDGWEQVTTDVSAIHNYNHGGVNEVNIHKEYEEVLKTKESILNSYPAHRNIYANGFKHKGEPIMLTEFGGISFAVEEKDGWGYSSVNDKEAFVKEYERIIRAIKNSEVIYGYCYTQLTDVEQEINGLLTYSRNKKVDLKEIKRINDLIDNKTPYNKDVL